MKTIYLLFLGVLPFFFGNNNSVLNENKTVCVAKESKRSSEKPIGNIYIKIVKSKYELYVYDDKGWFATYPVVFGNNTLSDKMMEGDRNTPEGKFKILFKKVHDKWHKFMLIDYPTKESYKKFAERKQKGVIPSNAKIGGSIGIHGTWPNEGWVVDRYDNWTLGCISMKNDDVDELYAYVQSGTEVEIVH